jgi:hypothetical protein
MDHDSRMTAKARTKKKTGAVFGDGTGSKQMEEMFAEGKCRQTFARQADYVWGSPAAWIVPLRVL